MSSESLIRLANLPSVERDLILNNAIERYGRGESVYQIALEIGVEHTTLYRQLLKHKESDWREAKISHALVDLEIAEKEMKNSQDMLALSRARETWRAASWHTERLLRKLYGQDQPIHNQVPIQINIGISRDEVQPLDVKGEQAS